MNEDVGLFHFHCYSPMYKAHKGIFTKSEANFSIIFKGRNCVSHPTNVVSMV